MADKHKPDWNDNSKRLLPITNIEHFNVGEAYEEPYSATLYVHRAAVKVHIPLQQRDKPSGQPDSIYLRGESDRESFCSRWSPAIIWTTRRTICTVPLPTTPPGDKNSARYARKSVSPSLLKQPGYRIPRSLYFTEGSRLAGTHTEGDKIIEDVYKVSVVINGVRDPMAKTRLVLSGETFGNQGK